MEEENGDAIFDTHFKTTRTYHTILYIIGNELQFIGIKGQVPNINKQIIVLTS